MRLAAITHYHRISNRLASSGQPQAKQLADIAQAGYQVVINLAMLDSKNAIADEEKMVTDLKMVYVHIPVPFDSPSPTHLRTFFKVMKTFEDAQVWVHCALNYRASAFLYHYHKMVLNQSEVEAKKAMLPAWQPNAVWRQFLQLEADDVSPL